MKLRFAATILLLAIVTGCGDLPSERAAERPDERTEALVTGVHAVDSITVLLPGGRGKRDKLRLGGAAADLPRSPGMSISLKRLPGATGSWRWAKP